MTAVERAQFRHPEAGEDEERDDRRPWDVVPAALSAIDPDLVTAAPANERARYGVAPAQSQS